MVVVSVVWSVDVVYVPTEINRKKNTYIEHNLFNRELVLTANILLLYQTWTYNSTNVK